MGYAVQCISITRSTGGFWSVELGLSFWVIQYRWKFFSNRKKGLLLRFLNFFSNVTQYFSNIIPKVLYFEQVFQTIQNRVSI